MDANAFLRRMLLVIAIAGLPFANVASAHGGHGSGGSGGGGGSSGGGVPQVVVIQRAPQVIQPARRVLATPQRLRRAVMSPPIQSASHNRGSTRPIITSGSTGFSSRSPAPAIRRNIGTHPATSGNAGILTSCSALSGIEKGVTPA